MREGTQGTAWLCLLNDPPLLPPPPAPPESNLLLSAAFNSEEIIPYQRNSCTLGTAKRISQTIDLRINILLFPQMPHLAAIVYINTPKTASGRQSLPGP